MARKTSAKTTAQATLTDDDHIAPKPSKRRASAKQVDTIPDDAPLDDLEDDSDDADHLDDFDAYSAQDDDAKTFASADFAMI